MFKFLVGLLPKEYQSLIAVGLRVVSQLDTAEERSEALTFAVLALADGKVTPGEWSQIGSKFGILRAPQPDERTSRGPDKKPRKKSDG